MSKRLATLSQEVETYVHHFGEVYRPLIRDALHFLTEQEPRWQLKKPVNRLVYLRKLIAQQK